MLKSDTINTTTKCSSLSWLGLSGILLLLDQLSKWWIVKNIAFGEFFPVIPSLSLTLTYNTGIAFSLFSQQAALGKWLLIAFTLFISLIVAIWLVQTPKDQLWNKLALSMILGGALGNVCDRIIHGHVIDFVDFYYQHWHFYTFNLADCFITVGAIMTIVSLIFTKEK